MELDTEQSNWDRTKLLELLNKCKRKLESNHKVHAASLTK